MIFQNDTENSSCTRGGFVLKMNSPTFLGLPVTPSPDDPGYPRTRFDHPANAHLHQFELCNARGRFLPSQSGLCLRESCRCLKARALAGPSSARTDFCGSRGVTKRYRNATCELRSTLTCDERMTACLKSLVSLNLTFLAPLESGMFLSSKSEARTRK